jgi:predicted dehydrogenase
MGDKIKAAVIGLGVGMAHARGYLVCADAELYAVCDADPARLNERGEELGVSASHRFNDYEKLLALPELDAVSIGLPNYLHAPVAIAAFQAGKHVLCEKPLATSTVEAQAMVDAGRKSGKTLMVCFNYRYREDARWLKEMETQGKFGHIYMAKAGWVRNSGIPGAGGWFTQKKLSGGGPLIDLGVHVLDLTIWLMNFPRVVTVSGATFAEFGPRGRKTWGKPRGSSGNDVEDLAAGFVRFANGAALLIETSWAAHIKPGLDDYFVTLYGSEGGSELYVHNYGTTDTTNFYCEEAGVPVQVKPDLTIRGGHELAVAHFVQCLCENRPVDSPGEQGLELMRLIDALYASARSGHEVRIDE